MLKNALNIFFNVPFKFHCDYICYFNIYLVELTWSVYYIRPHSQLSRMCSVGSNNTPLINIKIPSKPFQTPSIPETNCASHTCSNMPVVPTVWINIPPSFGSFASCIHICFTRRVCFNPLICCHSPPMILPPHIPIYASISHLNVSTTLKSHLLHQHMFPIHL